MDGKIIKILSNDYTVLGNDNNKYICKARGKFRNMKLTPLVGDYVTIDINTKVITNIKDRYNYLIRPSIANIDKLFIIASVKHPDLDLNLLDKLLVIAEYNRIQPVIVLTKTDLMSEDELTDLQRIIDYYEKIGYEVVLNTNIDRIKELLKDKIVVFTGQSGAGKSTLLNKLDSNFNIKTGEISLALGRGKHTTRHTELLNTCSSWIADTPGFSSLEFIEMTKEDIRDNFVDFQNLRDECKYKDCMHLKDDNCRIKEAVENNEILKSRYDNYKKFIEGMH